MILLIGSTGNIGSHVVDYLNIKNVSFREGIYNSEIKNDKVVPFDFLDSSTYSAALEKVNKVFFIRPPQIGNPKDIYPFLDYCRQNEIAQVVFVSLMGVEKNPIPPHAKIEKYILSIDLPYTFIRPSFFMENLIYPHGKDIKELSQIIVPAMKSKTSFIACKDIGHVCGETLINTSEHINQAYTLTGPEAFNYYEVAEKMSSVLEREIIYSNPSMRTYGKHMTKNNFEKEYIKITKLLYFMTRLGTAKCINENVKNLLNRAPTSLIEFIKENKHVWITEYNQEV